MAAVHAACGDVVRAASVFAAWAALAFASCRSNSAVAFRSFATSAGCGWILLDAAQPIARALQMRKIQRIQG